MPYEQAQDPRAVIKKSGMMAANGLVGILTIEGVTVTRGICICMRMKLSQPGLRILPIPLLCIQAVCWQKSQGWPWTCSLRCAFGRAFSMVAFHDKRSRICLAAMQMDSPSHKGDAGPGVDEVGWIAIGCHMVAVPSRGSVAKSEPQKYRAWVNGRTPDVTVPKEL